MRGQTDNEYASGFPDDELHGDLVQALQMPETLAGQLFTLLVFHCGQEILCARKIVISNLLRWLLLGVVVFQIEITKFISMLQKQSCMAKKEFIQLDSRTYFLCQLIQATFPQSIHKSPPCLRYQSRPFEPLPQDFTVD